MSGTHHCDAVFQSGQFLLECNDCGPVAVCGSKAEAIAAYRVHIESLEASE